jgi:deazaflavin-dependent oxidoreductase (nitroreductase family)
MSATKAPVPRVVNYAFAALIRLGLGKRYRHILTVTGRKTGKLHTTPVDVMTDGQQQWLVAPYGVTDWVRNARTAGQVTLQRGRHRETLRVTELPAEQRVRVLRRYLHEVPITASRFAATASSPDEVWAAEAYRHPVFRLDRP